MENKPIPGSYYQPLFDLLHQEHGITPLESEMTDIIFVVEKMRGKQEVPRWVKAIDFKYEIGMPYHAKDSRFKGAGHFNSNGVFIWGDCTVTHPKDQDDLYILDEQPAALKQIDREWICDALIEFTIAYIKSNNKDIANDAAEYLDDKLKDVGIVYMLSEDEQPASGREVDVKPFIGLKFRSRVAPINSYEVVDVFEQSKELKVKVTQECEVNRTTCYEVWSIEGFEKYYRLGVYFKQQQHNP